MFLSATLWLPWPLSNSHGHNTPSKPAFSDYVVDRCSNVMSITEQSEHQIQQAATIIIKVKATYLPEQSRPNDSKYVFAYTIRIENTGTEPAQLISRYWHIVDANEQVQEVQGMGVIGEQPRLEPGSDYTYTSGAILETDTGTMAGSYTMRTDNGELFDVGVPMFALVKPQALH